MIKRGLLFCFLVLFIILVFLAFGFRTKKIVAAIIPHDTFPSFIFDDFFSRLQKQNPKKIILIGPNHFEKGNFKVLTSLAEWQTPSGVVEADKVIIENLVSKNLAKVDEETLSSEHSIGTTIPFVKYYLPKAKVVPLILSAFLEKEEVDILVDELKNYLDKETVVVAAVDFSHNLKSVEAEEKDKLTEELMRNFDYENLFKLNNDYLDSPRSVITVLKIMEKKGIKKFEILYHTDSGKLQKRNDIKTTSYFSVIFSSEN